jgi:BlaI family penicillinase repressor
MDSQKKTNPGNNPATHSEPTHSEPTRSELDVLKILWQHGPSTVRFVHDILNQQKTAVQYTSTLKLMQVMTEKGILERDETNMKHIYSPLMEEQKTKGFILDKFIDSMYQGSVGNMVMALLGNDKTSKEDLQKVKDLLAKMDKKGKS